MGGNNTQNSLPMDLLHGGAHDLPLVSQKHSLDSTVSTSGPASFPYPFPTPIDYRRHPVPSYEGCDIIPLGQLSREPHEQLVDMSLSASTTTPIMAPFLYISSLPSKGIRDQVLEALNVWLDVPTDLLPQIGSIVADIHNTSLMLDDLEDGSPLRRSRPAAHTVFGIPQTVNAASYQLVDVISRASGIVNGTECQSIIIDAMKNMLVGQSLELHWVQHVSPPTVQEYLQMIDGRPETGALFRMIAQLMISTTQISCSAKQSPDLNNLMMLFGRFFQVRDDYANLVVDEYQDSKGYCEDLDEGKWSFILLHALDNSTPTNRSLLMNLLMQRHTMGCAGRGHKRLFLNILHDTGSLTYTANALCALQCEIEDEIRRIEDITGTLNPLARRMLERLQIGPC